MPKLFYKTIDSEKYILTQNGIFEGRGRKKKASDYAEFMRNEGHSARIEHKEKQTVVWLRSKK